jgi:hypothetical protein
LHLFSRNFRETVRPQQKLGKKNDMTRKALYPSFRIYTGFTKGTEDQVNQVAMNVLDGLANNPYFPNLPISLSVVSAQQVAYSDARTDARKGGTDRTRAKYLARQALVDSLLKLAHCCMSEARHNRAALLSTGFEIISTNHTPMPLDKPAIKDVLNNISGQMTVRGQGVLNARNYKLRASTDDGKTWTDMGTFGAPGRMLLKPTIPGTVYMLQFCALGGSKGQSDWSDPVTRMSS